MANRFYFYFKEQTENKKQERTAHSESMELLISCRWGTWAITESGSCNAFRDAIRAAAWWVLLTRVHRWILLNRLQTSIMTWGVQHMMMRSDGVSVQAKDLFTDAIKVICYAVSCYSDVEPDQLLHARGLQNARNLHTWLQTKRFQVLHRKIQLEKSNCSRIQCRCL